MAALLPDGRRSRNSIVSMRERALQEPFAMKLPSGRKTFLIKMVRVGNAVAISLLLLLFIVEFSNATIFFIVENPNGSIERTQGEINLRALIELIGQ